MFDTVVVGAGKDGKDGIGIVGCLLCVFVKFFDMLSWLPVRHHKYILPIGSVENVEDGFVVFVGVGFKGSIDVFVDGTCGKVF